MLDYDRISKAIVFIKENFKDQPNLDQVAKHVNLSPFHFQRLFQEWAGVSPKKFLQFISVQYAKDLLKENLSLMDATIETGLSGTGRLHDLFMNIEGMTPGEYKNGGKGLHINYSFGNSPFGRVIIASTQKGICHLAFLEHDITEIKNLQNLFPNALLQLQEEENHKYVIQFLNGIGSNQNVIALHLKGTPFQLKVWHSLLKIPFGSISTYNEISKKIHAPRASRAVGSAIGKNPVAFLIPCHRVIRSTGMIGEYHWGKDRKSAIIGWEAARLNNRI